MSQYRSTTVSITHPLSAHLASRHAYSFHCQSELLQLCSALICAQCVLADLTAAATHTHTHTHTHTGASRLLQRLSTSQYVLVDQRLGVRFLTAAKLTAPKVPSQLWSRRSVLPNVDLTKAPSLRFDYTVPRLQRVELNRHVSIRLN